MLFVLGLLHANPWITSFPCSFIFCDKSLVEDRLGIDIAFMFLMGIF